MNPSSIHYKKDFLEVKYLHEVTYTAPRFFFFFFQIFLKISKLQYVNSIFFERHL